MSEQGNGGSHPLMLVGCNSNRPLWDEVAAELGCKLAKAKIDTFADGSPHVEIVDSARGKDCYVLQSSCPPSIDHYHMEMLFVINALVRASAHRVTAVVPYYGYARGDKKLGPREPIGARVGADTIEVAGSQRMVGLTLHSASIPGFFSIPVDNLDALNKLADQIKKDGWAEADCVVVSPDVGGVERASYVAERLGLPMAIIAKRRDRPNECREDAEVIGDVAGRRAVIVDDMIDTAGSIRTGSRRLVDIGKAKAVRVYAVHGLFSGPAVERIIDSPIELVTVANTIPPVSSAVATCSKLRWISVADLISIGISHNHDGRSIDALFGRKK